MSEIVIHIHSCIKYNPFDDNQYRVYSTTGTNGFYTPKRVVYENIGCGYESENDMFPDITCIKDASLVDPKPDIIIRSFNSGVDLPSNRNVFIIGIVVYYYAKPTCDVYIGDLKMASNVVVSGLDKCDDGQQHLDDCLNGIIRNYIDAYIGIKKPSINEMIYREMFYNKCLTDRDLRFISMNEKIKQLTDENQKLKDESQEQMRNSVDRNAIRQLIAQIGQ